MSLFFISYLIISTNNVRIWGELRFERLQVATAQNHSIPRALHFIRQVLQCKLSLRVFVKHSLTIKRNTHSS
jgi:hypothetical protein